MLFVEPALGAPPAPSPAPAPAQPSPSRTVELRLALSPFALRTLSEPRLRRLVEIETESFAVMAPGNSGPLGDHVAYVWIDQPTTSKVVVEVRIGDHAVERRELAARGLASDVVARLIAVAVSKMVRAGMAPLPLPPPPPAGPRRPTPEEVERAGRAAPTGVLSPEGVLAGLPGASGLLGGAGLSVGFRFFGAGETLFARFMEGTAHSDKLRWLELGLSLDYRFWLSRSWRMAVGGAAALSSVHLPDALGVQGLAGQRDALSARAGGLLGLEVRLARPLWVSLAAEPGAILRPVHYTGAQRAAGVVEGAWVGASLGVRLELARSITAPGS